MPTGAGDWTRSPRLRGMFAFALWDEEAQRLVVARDRFGIKPLYTALVDDILYCASEAKALLPFLPSIETDLDGLRDYLTFQFPLANKTLFGGIDELPPAHVLVLERARFAPAAGGRCTTSPTSTTPSTTSSRSCGRSILDSVEQHLVADVPVGAYLSGGLDSSIVATLAEGSGGGLPCVHRPLRRRPSLRRIRIRRGGGARGSFDLRVETSGPRTSCGHGGSRYHLDFPVAGPGSFAQYAVSRCGRAGAEGRARRTGRRRDLRRLRAVSRRVLRAVHQGGDRGHEQPAPSS